MEGEPLKWFNFPRGGAFSLPTEWWIEAGMDLFPPGEELSYARTAHPPSKLYPVRAIEPPHMGQRLRRGHGGFTHNRMVNVLRDIARRREIRPIEMIEGASDEYSYRVKDGAHRFHASVVAGFPLIPNDHRSALLTIHAVGLPQAWTAANKKARELGWIV